MPSCARLRLEVPSLRLKEAYLDYRAEWVASGERFVPWVVERDPADFDAMLAELDREARGEGLPDGWVPCSTFWIADAADRIVGVVNIRHGPNTTRDVPGSHIGLGIRPSERRKGYAEAALRLALANVATREPRALLVCDEWNAASAGLIQKLGGVEGAPFMEGERPMRRFWVELG